MPSGGDLLDDPSLRQGLVNLWSAEVDEAGLEIRSLERLGNGVKESDDGFALAQLWAGRTSTCCAPAGDNTGEIVVVKADVPRFWTRQPGVSTPCGCQTPRGVR